MSKAIPKPSAICKASIVITSSQHLVTYQPRGSEMSANAHLGNCSIRLDQGHSGFKGLDRRRAFFSAATAIIVWVLLSSIGAIPAMSAEQFMIQLADGKILFNENDVESYSAATNTFILSPASSKRLVSNWAAFVKD